MNGLDSFVVTSIAANIKSMDDNQLRLLSKMIAYSPNGDRLSFLIAVERFDADMTNKDELDIEVQEPVC
jgi:hypothetical protein